MKYLAIFLARILCGCLALAGQSALFMGDVLLLPFTGLLWCADRADEWLAREARR